MKKLILVLTLFAFISINVRAQWTQSGNNLYPTNQSSKIGIGITNPPMPLSVKGVISIHDSRTTPDPAYFGCLQIAKPPESGQYISMVRRNQYAWSIGTVYNTNTFAIGEGRYTSDSDFIDPDFVITTYGLVGLGVVEPTQRLDVKGNTNLTPATSSTDCKYLINQQAAISRFGSSPKNIYFNRNWTSEKGYFSDYENVHIWGMRTFITSANPYVKVEPDERYTGVLTVTGTPEGGQMINISRANNAMWSIGTRYRSDVLGIGTATTRNELFDPILNLTPEGQVGIGTYTPSETLEVNGKSLFNRNVSIGAKSAHGGMLEIYSAQNPLFILRSDRGYFQIGHVYNNEDLAKGSKAGDIVFSNKSTSSHNILLNIASANTSSLHYIGISDEQNGVWAKFFNNKTFRIDGSVFAKELTIQANVWSDFVFNDDYKLRSLNEVETFIKENKHLPDIPNEEAVKANGIDVAEMNALLLQKVEELTLYVISLNNEIEQLKAGK